MTICRVGVRGGVGIRVRVRARVRVRDRVGDRATVGVRKLELIDEAAKSAGERGQKKHTQSK